MVEAQHGASHDDVSQRNTFAHQVSVIKKVIVQSGHGLLDVFLGSFCGVFVELHNTEAREDPSAGGGKDVRVGKVQPLENLRLSKGVLSSTQLLIGHIIGNGIAFE